MLRLLLLGLILLAAWWVFGVVAALVIGGAGLIADTAKGQGRSGLARFVLFVYAAATVPPWAGPNAIVERMRKIMEGD